MILRDLRSVPAHFPQKHQTPAIAHRGLVLVWLVII